MTLRLVKVLGTSRSGYRTATVADVDDDSREESGRWTVHWQTRVADWCDCLADGTESLDDDWPPVRLNGHGIEIIARACDDCGLIVSPQIKIIPSERPLPIHPGGRRRRQVAVKQEQQQTTPRASSVTLDETIVGLAEQLLQNTVVTTRRHDCRMWIPEWDLSRPNCHICSLRKIRAKIKDPRRIRRDAYLAAAELVARTRPAWLQQRAEYVKQAEHYSEQS